MGDAMARPPAEILPGTLDMLVLRVLARESLHGYVDAAWSASQNNRRARYYTLTTEGRRYLARERTNFDRYVVAIQRVLQTG
jgi:PadR family transcriptional regulator, regulatory protein PadR